MWIMYNVRTRQRDLVVTRLHVHAHGQFSSQVYLYMVTLTAEVLISKKSRDTDHWCVQRCKLIKNENVIVLLYAWSVCPIERFS